MKVGMGKAPRKGKRGVIGSTIHNRHHFGDVDGNGLGRVRKCGISPKHQDDGHEPHDECP